MKNSFQSQSKNQYRNIKYSLFFFIIISNIIIIIDLLTINKPFAMCFHWIFSWPISNNPTSGIEKFSSFTFPNFVMVRWVITGRVWGYRVRPEGQNQPQGPPENCPEIRWCCRPVAMRSKFFLLAFLLHPDGHLISSLILFFFFFLLGGWGYVCWFLPPRNTLFFWGGERGFCY